LIRANSSGVRLPSALCGRSRFVVFGRKTDGLIALAGRADSALLKIPIAVSKAEEILHELKISGISESMIFPDLDGLGRELDLVFQERCKIAFGRSPSFRTPKRVRIEMKPSRVHKDGVGVFAASPISKEGFIAPGIYEKDLRSQIPGHFNKSYTQTIQQKVQDFCIGSPKGFIPPEDFDFNSLSIEWYFNHSCDGNIGFNRDGDFVARRNIKRGEELTYDYGLGESNPKFKIDCSCGSPHCRRKITGNDWKGPTFRKRNLDYMLPILRRDPRKPN
jgi:SET domain